MTEESREYFFSYARGDGAFALKLATDLRSAGANVWIDQLDILGGQRWDQAVEQSLRTCHGMIVVLSPQSAGSTNVMDEVSYALDENKLIVPILLSNCDIPFRLRRLQYIDFSRDYQTGLASLLKALSIQEKPVGPLDMALVGPPAEEPRAPAGHVEPAPPVGLLPRSPVGGTGAGRLRRVLVGTVLSAILGAVCYLSIHTFEAQAYPVAGASMMAAAYAVGGACTTAIAGNSRRQMRWAATSAAATAVVGATAVFSPQDEVGWSLLILGVPIASSLVAFAVRLQERSGRSR